MYNNKKVIVCTPFGRRSTFSIMKEYTLANRNIIDEHRLWINTIEMKDVRYAYTLNDAHPDFFKIVEVGPKLKSMDHASRCRRLKYFYFTCTNENTIYIKMDDDIVYMCPEFFEQLLYARLKYPEHFMIFGNIVNNGICNHLHQRMGALDSAPFTVWHAGAGQGWWWNSWEGGYVCHRSFLSTQKPWNLNVDEKNGNNHYRKYWIPDWTMHAEHMSINCICWNGKDFLDLNNEYWEWIEANDENSLSEWIPAKMGKRNLIAGKALCCHYAYFPQLDGLNKYTDLLNRYANIAGPEDAIKNNPRIKYSKLPTSDIQNRINFIRQSSTDELLNVEYLEHKLIPVLGLYSGDLIYVPDSLKQYAGGLEMWQSPKQLAKFLVYLSDKKINKYAELGIARGGLFILMTEYLSRFGLSDVYACDLYIPELIFQYQNYKPDNVNICIIPGSSQSSYLRSLLNNSLNKDKTNSLIFIDDEHEYPICLSNYEQLGINCSYAAFHDVNDGLCPGVMKVWREIKQGQKYQEFFDEYPNLDIKMGIGVIEHV